MKWPRLTDDFLRGMESAFSLFPAHHGHPVFTFKVGGREYSLRITPSEALRSDWDSVGRDFHGAIRASHAWHPIDRK